MMFGKEMRLPFDVDLQPKDNLSQDTREYLKEFMSRLKIAHEIGQKNVEYHQQRNKERYDRTAKTPHFKIGDTVLTTTHQVRKGQSSKLWDKCTGPYQIVGLEPNYTYRLRRISDNKVHQSLVSAIHLK